MHKLVVYAAGSDKGGVIQFFLSQSDAARFCQGMNDHAQSSGLTIDSLGVKLLKLSHEQVLSMLNACLIMQLKEKANATNQTPHIG